MKAQEIMGANPACCAPEDTVQEAARLMQQHDCGCLPVVENTGTKRLLGVVTDRDLAVRGLAAGKGPDALVSDVMSREPSCCTPDDDVETVSRIMTERQVRRVPVIDHAGCCVGMIAQADLAREGGGVTDREVGRVVEGVSAPSDGARRETDVGIRPERS